MRFPSAFAVLFALAGSLALSNQAFAAPQDADADADGPYAKPTIDVAVFVSDVKATQTFYEEVLGFKKLEQFTVPKQITGDSGLTDYRSYTAHVMAIGAGPDATRVKLVQMPGAPGARVDNRFVNSTYGPSYLTLHVRDMNPILKAAADRKLKPLSKGPVDLGGGRHLALLRDPDGNFIELVGGRGADAEEEELLEDAAEDAAEDAVEETGDAAESVGDVIEDAGEAIDDATDEE